MACKTIPPHITTIKGRGPFPTTKPSDQGIGWCDNAGIFLFKNADQDQDPA
jgi:hypothetical protein